VDSADLYAHTPNSAGHWHPLSTHLVAVAVGAHDRASAFSPGAGDLAFLVGLYHDLGKANPAFQQYLLARNAGRSAPKAPHSIWGAAFVYQALRQRSPARC
jgi:CRISPR-associated endonuclease/helicase Cas3